MRFNRKLSVCLALCTFVMSMGAAIAFAATPVFTFKGDGYSHGVGMSQMGTLKRASLGQSTETILKAYFKGTAVSTKSELSSKSVKIALDKGKSSRASWKVRAGNIGGKFRLNTTDPEYTDANTYTFKVVGGKICMFEGLSVKPKRTISSDAVELIPTNGSPKLMEVRDASGPFSYNDVRYRGKLRIEKEGNELNLYNVVSVQDYLYGVVPRELGASYYKAAPAASRVQAICARSYAYAAIMNGSSLYCTTSSQVYGGYGRWTSSSRANHYDFEEAQSNTAVNDTNNKCVTYNGNVITTYFGSCNGSVTANKEDVWGGSALPYYQGVADPTHTESSHNWTVTVDGMALAKTLKSKGASVPSGAGSSVYVKALTPTYGKNGWVRSMKVTWSNGATTTISYGDAVRVKFGLKSAHFKLSSTGTSSSGSSSSAGIPAGADLWRTQESSKAVRRYGSWNIKSLGGSSGGRRASSKVKNNYLMVKFKGEGISWVGSKGPSYGRAKVYVDGVYKKTVDLHSSSTKRQQRLYTISGLNGSKIHTFKIVVTNKSGSSAAGTVGFDAADIINGSSEPYLSHSYQETSSVFKHSKYSIVSHKDYSGDRAYRTITSGKYFSTRVKAQNVEVYSKVSPKGGRFKVYVNGRLEKTVNLKSSSTRYGVKVYSRGLNPSKTYSIKLVSTTASGSKKPGEVVFDRFLTYDGTLKK